jgi:hypothetical protein
MFPVPWIVSVVYLAAYACAGMAVGACTGVLVFLGSKVKLPSKMILANGLIGVCGFFAGFIGTLFTPGPENTESHFEGITLVSSTMRGYQHPERIGFLVAVVFPLVWTLHRLRRARSGVTSP